MVEVRDATAADVVAMTEIQNALLASTTIEWTETPRTVAEREAWFADRTGAGFPVLVAVDADRVVGWASYGDFRDSAKWPGYRFTVEHTVHVAQTHWEQGVGRALVTELIDRARAAGKHVLVAGVDGANEQSLRFHERLGFTEVARMPQVGHKFGRWLDLVLFQLVLDPGGRRGS
jgi:phosphinothricin acetyltransferase